MGTCQVVGEEGKISRRDAEFAEIYTEKSSIFTNHCTKRSEAKGKSFGSRGIVYFGTSTSSNASTARCQGILRQMRRGWVLGNPVKKLDDEMKRDKGA